VPSQKELRWSQLKVGILTLCALAALTVIIFLLAGSTGGLFTPKLHLRAYFENANGLKVGAPVTLDGVTIGNVTHVRIVPNHEPAAVEVISRVGMDHRSSLHTDSMVTINQAGVLGDAFIDISSVHATGPEPADFATLKVATTPGIQDVIRTSQESIQSINVVVHKVSTLLDTLNSGKGTAGVLLNDPDVAKKIVRTIDALQTLAQNISSGKGTIGKLINDDDLYNRANSTIDKLNANTNELLSGINTGKGSLGKLAKDPAFANKVEESITRLNGILEGLQEGKGSLGQMVVNKSLYNNLDKTLNDAGQLLTAIRKDPKTYLTIHVKVF